MNKIKPVINKQILLILVIFILTQCVSHEDSLANKKEVLANDTNFYNPNQNPVFFRIKGKNNYVYIFGRIYIKKAIFFPFTEIIENAFVNSEILVVETNILNEETKIKLEGFRDYTIIDNEKTIDRIISLECYDKLKKKFEQYNLPIEQLYLFS